MVLQLSAFPSQKRAATAHTYQITLSSKDSTLLHYISYITNSESRPLRPKWEIQGNALYTTNHIQLHVVTDHIISYVQSFLQGNSTLPCTLVRLGSQTHQPLHTPINIEPLS